MIRTDTHYIGRPVRSLQSLKNQNNMLHLAITMDMSHLSLF